VITVPAENNQSTKSTAATRKVDKPVSIASGDAETESRGEVEPESLSELPSDRCDGHLVGVL